MNALLYRTGLDRIGAIRRWQERRDLTRWERWERKSRWSELAAYNSRVGQGIVHTPEYVERMRKQQAAFDRELGYSGGGLPITLGPDR